MISVHIALHNDFGFIHASVHNALINNCGSEHFYFIPNFSLIVIGSYKFEILIEYF